MEKIEKTGKGTNIFTQMQINVLIKQLLNHQK
jgi:hypothetical protein